MKTVWTDRSRTEQYQRCPRLRFLEYHEGPDHMGIQPSRKPLALCVGGSVHVGLEHLLLGMDEDAAVLAAIADFSQFKSALALDLAESTAMATPVEGFDAQVAAQARELGLDESDPQVAELFARQRNAAAEFDAWLYAEQSALVEGLVRAYARRRLPVLLAEFEVLEVEREGQWLLSHRADDPDAGCYEGYDLYFMSRPDALLRSRTDNSLYLLSFKTAATWDVRKARDAEHDMQGLSEGVEVERRLSDWWDQLHNKERAVGDIMEPATREYLLALPAPPRILGIRYEYMLKGYRSEDKDLSARFGLKVWAQKSHLVRKYVATSVPSRGVSAYNVGDECWSYDWLKDDGSSSKLAWQNWRSRPVWEDGPGAVKAWIDRLDATEMTMSAEDSTVGLEPRPLGYKSAAQALGLTATHPLDDVFPAPLTVYRSDDQLRDWVEQVEAQERRVAEAVAQVESAADDGDRRHALNVHFPMARRACSYPTECAFTKVCYGGDDIRSAPLESGLFKVRVPNHPQETTEVTK